MAYTPSTHASILTPTTSSLSSAARPKPSISIVDSTASRDPTEFSFPPSHAFPPLYTLQPNPTTRQAQFSKWSRIIQLYCRHHRLDRLCFPSCLDLPLFRNTDIKRRLGEREAREVVNWMTSEEGGKRAEWVDEGKSGGAKGTWFRIFWHRPEEWADLIYGWVEGTGQRGSVLTEYELFEGEATRGEEFHDMDKELFQRALGVLVKRGKAQIFGDEDSRGVKFF